MSAPPTPSPTAPLLEPGASGRLSSLRIRVLSGPDAGREVMLNQPRILIGRAEGADLRLSDPTVSQFHAELTPRLAGTQIADLGSRNGVRMGEVQVERGAAPPGCAFTMTLGQTILRVEPVGLFETPRSEAASFGQLIGSSQAMRELYGVLERLGRSDLSVLIQGETGTGKELVARALHEAGARQGGPFVVLDCTALPPTLAPSVLFGHEKGAFTGATERRIGVFEAAHGGVLFMDEVGELPLELQPLLLRVLQGREVTPVGTTRPRQVNVRVMCATWRDLRAMVNAGTFREDLYYRLAQAVVWTPPLSRRREDVPLLVQHFLSRLPQGVPAARTISEEALQALSLRTFPGNVRELQSTVERLAMLAEGGAISTSDLAFERMLARERELAPGQPLGLGGAGADREGEADGGRDPGPLQPFKDEKQTVIDEFERGYLQRLLQRTAQNLSRAAALAGLERHNLRALLRKHGLYGRDVT